MHRRQIKIFLADGTPTGLRTAELGLSTCKAVIAPRASLAALQSRVEAKRTGVYILVGPDPDHAGRDAIYVGEGDNVFSRIAKHDKDDDKEFWETVVLFVSKDENLTKAHVRHLEGRLVKLAHEAKRCRVVNATAPDGGQLPEADLAEMDELLEHVQLLLGTLGVHAFHLIPVHPRTSSEANGEPAAIKLQMAGNGYQAECILQDGSFTVLAGSHARREEATSLADWARSTRAALKENGVLIPKDGHFEFTQDYAFASASGSAGVVSGTTVNGKIAWHMPDGRTFKDWEEATLQAGEAATDSDA